MRCYCTGAWGCTWIQRRSKWVEKNSCQHQYNDDRSANISPLVRSKIYLPWHGAALTVRRICRNTLSWHERLHLPGFDLEREPRAPVADWLSAFCKRGRKIVQFSWRHSHPRAVQYNNVNHRWWVSPEPRVQMSPQKELNRSTHTPPVLWASRWA